MVSAKDTRINKELKELNENPIEGVSVEADPVNQFKWIINISGPRDTPYEGGCFKVQNEFPDNYPFKAPTIKFLTKIYHPNVKFDTGEICHMYQEEWVPTKKARSLVDYIRSLMFSPNMDNPIEATIADEYRTNNSTFRKKAAEYTLQFAPDTNR